MFIYFGCSPSLIIVYFCFRFENGEQPIYLFLFGDKENVG